MWGELNNGRALSLFDIGRYGFLIRSGLFSYYFKNKTSMTVAGLSVRYRHRVTTFQMLKMKTQIVFYDEKFLYFEQLLVLPDGRCAIQSLCRVAIVQKKKLITPSEAANQFLGKPLEKINCPQWIKKWIEAEKFRTWPPELLKEQ